MRFHKDMLLLYAITEERGSRQRPLIEMVKEALEGGVTILQLREKHLSDEELMTEALEIKELCHSYGVPLIIYIGVGAVFPSPTKQNAVRITNAQLREITSAVSIPAVAIGGITLENISQIDCSTLSGIAVVSAVFGAEDITQAAKELIAKATALVHS